MTKFRFLLLPTFFLIASTFCGAQSAPTAQMHGMRINVGAFGSAFQPDYEGGGIAQTSSNRLFGIGAYVDLQSTRWRWVQLEGEARWLRFNQFANIHEDHYLIGPKVPVYHFGPATAYGKVLFGINHINFEFNDASCRCTDIAYGGGVDVRLSRKLTLRAFDFEYQELPNWYRYQNAQMFPYGGSVGLAYRVF